MNLFQQLLEAKHKRQELLDKADGFLAAKDLESHKTTLAEIKALNAEIDALEAQLAEKGRYTEGGEGSKMTPALSHDPKDAYGKAVKSFAEAARLGFPVQKAASAGSMMQEGVDADGGYAVPQDLVTKIISLRESKESLLDEVMVIPVTAQIGSRTIKKRSQHTGFSTVEEAAKFGKVATPQFTTIKYSIKKRGGYLPVTNELLADSDNNIAAFAVEWLADEARVTANKEIMTAVALNDSTDLTDLDGILTAWVGLGSAFRSTSKLITNDDVLAYLGTLKDQNGRFLLNVNPADPKQLQLCIGPHVLPVKTYDNDTIPSTGTKIPMILGDLKAGIAYWDRQSFSIKVSDTAVVGEINAFEEDLTLWRGSLRDDCTLWDNESFVNGYIDTAAAVG